MRRLGADGRRLQPAVRVGFDTLPDQVVNREAGLGYRFNMLVVGETAVGKSSLLDSLFDHSFEAVAHEHADRPAGTETVSAVLTDGGVELELTATSSCYFGDAINRSNSETSIIQYIDHAFEEYLQEELKAKRSLRTIKDSRVHVCLYLLAPTVTSLKALDLVTMQRLQEKVNLVPVITKADTVTQDELAAFKALLRQEFAKNNIKLFVPDGVDPNTLPFAVVASKEVVRMGNQRSRVRQYPWGMVEVENEKHSDFLKLRRMLFRTNMEKLRESTRTDFYEQYRKFRLQQMGIVTSDGSEQSLSLSEALELKRKEYAEFIAAREEEIMASLKEKSTAQKKQALIKAQALEDLKARYKQADDDSQRELDELERALNEQEQELKAAKEREEDSSKRSKSKSKSKDKDKEKQ